LRHWGPVLNPCVRPRVLGLIGQRLSDASLATYVPSDVRKSLGEEARQTAARMLRAQAQVLELASGFGATSIPVIALKGVHLAQAVYPNLTLRTMQDIDLLVSREHLPRATDIALSLGYSPVRPFTVEQEASAKHHVTRLVRPDSLDVEIH
jgi:hypothetical protein